jgi:FkbM family methyltransferase
MNSILAAETSEDLRPLLPLWPLRGRSIIPAVLRRWVKVPSGRVLRTKFDTRIRLRDDWMYEGLYFFGEYEPWQTRIYRSLIRPGDVCLDVGANFGWYSTLFALWCGDSGAVHAFEPVPAISEMTADALGLNGVADKVHLCRFGLGDACGQFVVYQFDGLSHGHASAFDLGRQDARPTTCEVRTLDDYVRERSLGRVDFIKMDVEGYEREVLLGGRALLSGEDAPIVAFEVNVQCLESRKLPGEAVQRVLLDCGFDHFWAVGPRRELFKLKGSVDSLTSRDYVAAKGDAARRVKESLRHLMP